MTFHRYNGNGPVDEVIIEEYLQLDKLRLQVAKRWQRQPIAMLLSTFSSLPPSVSASEAHGSANTYILAFGADEIFVFWLIKSSRPRSFTKRVSS
jgi:hypothetical protein